MLNAKQARFETKYHRQMNEVMDRCDKAVKSAISEEKYRAIISIDLRDIAIDVCQEAVGWLKSLGYEAELQSNGRYYVLLVFSWEKEIDDENL